MADISDIVSVSVSISAQSPNRATFAVPLIAGFHTRFAELTRDYVKLTDMIVDGFSTEDAEYQAAVAIFSQTPTVPRIKVGRLSGVQTVRVVTLLANAFNSTAYAITINGRSYSFTSDASGTAAEIATGLVAVINADVTIPVTASVSTNNLVLTADVAGPDFFVNIADVSLWASVQDSSLVRSSVSTDLAAILASDPDWYALVLTRNSHLDAVLAAAFVQANTRVFLCTAINFGAIVTAQDCLASNATNLPGVLKAASYTRTYCQFTKHDADYAAAGLGAVVLCKVVGSWTAHAKTIAGATADALTPTEQVNLDANRCNHYQPIAGINLTQKGVMSSARFFDEIVIQDWLTSTIKTEHLALQVFLDKIPFTAAGIALVGNSIMKVLQKGVEQGAFVVGSIFVRLPDVAGILSADKIARLLTGVEFGATLAGAIHKTEIRGNLTP